MKLHTHPDGNLKLHLTSEPVPGIPKGYFELLELLCKVDGGVPGPSPSRQVMTFGHQGV